ncbi:protein of unknown function [Nitrospira japonica]|uniref:Uncharacterized protein n=1 Tax=Nitrospira japonica TaxID=1325564 RepID=A0A1W1I424_9BACT|nr:hypothetical protein [Nitrospira japonica]SLM47573.1 protein of unknown function [Nitrospira japonica]
MSNLHRAPRAWECAIVLLLMVWCITTPHLAWAAEFENPFDVNMNDPAALHEATRTLVEEVKLAARPQTYLLIDLAAKAVVLKARGVELHRLPIMEWSADSQEKMTGIFRLTVRPAVARRKVDPSGTEQEPISLTDMPASYDLLFSPPLALTVVSPAEQAPVRWSVLRMKRWWQWLNSQIRALASRSDTQADPSIALTLAENEAQSLAWSLTDGMPAIIRRTSPR